MKLDWRKITRKFLLEETDNKHVSFKKIEQVCELLANIKVSNKIEEYKIAETLELLESLKSITNELLTENIQLKERVTVLEENKINEFLD